MEETETESESEDKVNKYGESDLEEEERDYAEFKRIHDKDKAKKGTKRTKEGHQKRKHFLSSDKGEVMEGAGAVSEKVKVIVRCRPLSEKEKLQGHTRIVQISSDQKALEVHRPNPSSSNLVNAKVDKTFTFDAVYDERTSQGQLYDEAFKDLVNSVLEGFNGTIFAYGQTASGKTYTMEGIRDIREEQGVIPNAFRHIFKRIQESPNLTYLVSASYLEIYQEEVKDLLSPKLKICELKENSSGGGVHVKGLTSFLCRDFDEINSLMSTGNKNRSTGATNMNEHSSRSHAVFMISVEMSEEWADGETHCKVGHLNLVDLAGSERQGKTGAEGERLKEAVKINLSLSALGNVIGALADGKNGHIPYRDSKLTRLLQNSLGGNARTIMVATIGPASFNYDETVVTLRYASRAKRIKNKPKINEDPKDAMLRNYQLEIAKLRGELEAKMSRQREIGSAVSDEGGSSDSARRRRSGTASASKNGIFDNTLLKELEPYLESYGLGSQRDPKEVLKILAEKRQALLSDTATVKEEKERLINKLESTHRKVEQAEEECSELHDRIEWLQSKVLNGGKNLLDHTNEQQRLIEQRQLELDQEKIKEDQMRQKIVEHDLGVVELREIRTTLEAQNTYDEKKVKKMESKVSKWRTDRQERVEKHGYDVSRLQRYLIHNQKEDELEKGILENFVPNKMQRILESLAQQNEDDSFSFMPITSIILPRPRVNRMTLFPLYMKSLDGLIQPRTNFYYVDENILQLQPIPPARVTKHYVPPDTDPHIKSVMERALAEAEKDVVIDCSRSGHQPKRRVKTARVRLGEVLTFENNWSVRQVLSAKHRSKEIPYKDFVAVKRPPPGRDKSIVIPLKNQLRRVNHVSLSPNFPLGTSTCEETFIEPFVTIGSSKPKTPAQSPYYRPCVTPDATPRHPYHPHLRENVCKPINGRRYSMYDDEILDLNMDVTEELTLLKLDEIQQKRRLLEKTHQKHSCEDIAPPGFYTVHKESFPSRQPPPPPCTAIQHSQGVRYLNGVIESQSPSFDWISELSGFGDSKTSAPPPTVVTSAAATRRWSLPGEAMFRGQPSYNIKSEELPIRPARHIGTATTEEHQRRDPIRARTNCFPPQTTVSGASMRRNSIDFSESRSGSSASSWGNLNHPADARLQRNTNCGSMLLDNTWNDCHPAFSKRRCSSSSVPYPRTSPVNPKSPSPSFHC